MVVMVVVLLLLLLLPSSPTLSRLGSLSSPLTKSCPPTMRLEERSVETTATVAERRIALAAILTPSGDLLACRRERRTGV